METIHSILLYGAPVWSGILSKEKYRQAMIKAQRRPLLRMCSAYRTVSAIALQVVAWVIPIDILADERVRLYKRGNVTEGIKQEEREKSIGVWQTRWGKKRNKAVWTRELIPDVRSWYECKHRRTNYYFTQFLTGHGSFRKYTYGIKKTADDLPPNVEYRITRNMLFWNVHFSVGRGRESKTFVVLWKEG